MTDIRDQAFASAKYVPAVHNLNIPEVWTTTFQHVSVTLQLSVDHVRVMTRSISIVGGFGE